jgi:hypothetical protein
MATRLRAGLSGFRMPVGAIEFPRECPHLLLGPTQPPEWGGREVKHSSPSTAQVEKEWIYAFAHLTCLLGMDRENFTSPNLYPFTATS